MACFLCVAIPSRIQEMSAKVKEEIELEIAHVLFVDIVGYSKLLITEQRERLEALNEVVRNAMQFRSSDANGMLVRIPTGDHRMQTACWCGSRQGTGWP